MGLKEGVFADRVAVITGASSGLGAALAVAFVQAGAAVAIFGRNGEKLDEVAGECRRAGGEGTAVVGDVTRPEDCRRLVETAVAEWGRVDYLVANAGLSMWAPFEEIEDLELFRRLIEVNYLGALHCAHFGLPHLKESRGMFVAVSSIQGKIGVPLHTGYVASKHALQGFCDTLRLELDGSGVEVLTVMPHWLRGTNLRQNAFGRDGQPLGPSSRKHSSESIPMEVACQAILTAVHKRRRQLVIPWKLRLLLAVNFIRAQWAEALIKGAVNKQD